MSTQADALLNELTEGTATLGEAELGTMALGMDYYRVDMHEHITIGADRIIVVPDAVKRIAVQFDHNIEVATFDCIRYWDNTDMSTMKVYIEYIRSDGVGGSTEATNVIVDEVDPNIMHFNWVVTRHTTLVSGKMQVKVCIRSVDDSGFEENHWNTEINDEMFISMGFETHELMKESYPDEFAQLQLSMEELATAANETLDAANKAVSDVQAIVDDAEVKIANVALAAQESAQEAKEAADQAMSVFTIDDELSETSLNPVQNKVITAALGDIQTVLSRVIGGE